MKTSNYYLILLSVFVALLVSCDDKDTPEVPALETTISVVKEIMLSDGAHKTLTIKTTVVPILTTDAPWLHIGAVQLLKEGFYTADIYADENKTGEPRTAQISVMADDAKAVVEVSQVSGDVIEIKNINEKLDLDPEGGNFEVNYVSTSDPIVYTPDWISYSPVRSIDEGTISLGYSPNYSGADREGEVMLRVNMATVSFKVIQKMGGRIEIKGVEPDSILDPNGGVFLIRYEASDVPKVEIPDWIGLSSSSDLEEGTLAFKYLPNYSDKSREAEIRLGIGDSFTASVKVYQSNIAMPNEMGSTAMQIASRMYAGINIGNTMECPGQEGAWSKPVNATYVVALAKMGFNAVRIPCAWDSHLSDEAANTIDPAWLDRVDEVVGYVISNGMYAILNIHWDGGWLENSCKEGYDEAVNKKQHDYWTQIANKLNHYDEHLLLAAMNEPNVAEGNNKKKDESIKAIMKYQQTMLDAVRATGGNNASRVLVMQAPNTSNEIAVEGLYELPKDGIADRLMIETHFYGPYQFNMMENDANWGKCFWYWGKDNHVKGSDHNSTWGEEDWVKEQFALMKKHYIDKGIPGITGEYCVCCNRENTKGIDKEKWRASARLWAKVVTRESKNAGMVPFYWETGGDIERSNGSVKNSLQIDGLFEGAAEGKYPF